MDLVLFFSHQHILKLKDDLLSMSIGRINEVLDWSLLSRVIFSEMKYHLSSNVDKRTSRSVSHLKG